MNAWLGPNSTQNLKSTSCWGTIAVCIFATATITYLVSTNTTYLDEKLGPDDFIGF